MFEVPLTLAGDATTDPRASASTDAVSDAVDSRSLDRDLITALRSLVPRMRAVVVLRFVEDRSEQETAELLGCSVGTVKSTAHRGLARLRAGLVPVGRST